ncbi:11642_t:CDS:2 [Cetraspora pellucida]|uniref:11642_t:CDS:1 n=1 Tax=Cetraspora pellucida TaxID=1433469 RepID=A0ACA9MN28_9GLOM|nr:11642_t:CDS:2 [Cetraspora pellucida]
MTSNTIDACSLPNNNNNSFHININPDNFQQPTPSMQRQYYPPLQYAQSPHSSPVSNPSNKSTASPIIKTNVKPYITVQVSSGGYKCQYCNSTNPPEIKYYLGARSYIVGALLCCVFPPLFWLPCVSSSFMDESSTCPDCRRKREVQRSWTGYAIILGVVAVGIIITIIIVAISANASSHSSYSTYH